MHPCPSVLSQVPVGGSLVASPDPAFVEKVAQTYAGRASIAPVLDLFISLLCKGRKKLQVRADIESASHSKLVTMPEPYLNHQLLCTRFDVQSWMCAGSESCADDAYLNHQSLCTRFLRV